MPPSATPRQRASEAAVGFAANVPEPGRVNAEHGGIRAVDLHAHGLDRLGGDHVTGPGNGGEQGLRQRERRDDHQVCRERPGERCHRGSSAPAATAGTADFASSAPPRRCPGPPG